ncbi:glycosyltransferase family 4 protein [Fusobacterium sp. SYSU M8D902]|uniref:glycosyltransferase family 4 protein n=1 Tax=Fusobacterium sp. SYSU M8D902 TaxID=3159562 RepID=UPI0032E4CB4D
MYSLIIYDTSNFKDFPIGGQLTSIRNFLLYITEEHPEECKKILLVGITTDECKVGKIQIINIGEKEFDFLPILYREVNLNNIKKSMRLEYLKALFKFRKYIPNGEKIIHYLHTPEAFIQIKLCHPFSKIAVFSHGDFFNMLRGFRFYRNNKLVNIFFNKFIEILLKKSDLIFTLDKVSLNKYLKYNKNVISVDNSIVIPKELPIRDTCHDPLRLLFVGRFSKVKRIDGIIKAVLPIRDKIELTILGDGEEKEYLENLIRENDAERHINLLSSVSPEKVKEYMKNNDVLIMNSIIEGKPMTILEAMSYGMPIITTDVGGISEIVKFKKNSLKIDGETESIISAINFSKNNYKILVKNSFLESKRFDFKIVNKKIFFLLKNMNSN